MTELVLTEELLEGWPQRVNGAFVEPGTGCVRIRANSNVPIQLTTAEARLLGEHARTNRKRVLFAAADEADRQLNVLLGVMQDDTDGASLEEPPAEEAFV